MKIYVNEVELKAIYSSLRASKEILENAELIALRNIEDNPQEYFKYSDYLAQINPLIEKIKGYLNEYID